MDTIVTARIPVEIKIQANEVLKSIDATPTQLINAAYEYVLSTGSLPRATTESPRKKKVLSAEDKKLLLASIEETSFSVPAAFWQQTSYQAMIEEGRQSDYEALA